MTSGHSKNERNEMIEENGKPNAPTLATILVRHGIIDQAAIEDPDGYDGGQTKKRVLDASNEMAKNKDYKNSSSLKK